MISLIKRRISRIPSKKGRITYGQLVQELKEGGAGKEEEDEYCKLVAALEDRYQKALDRGIAQPETYAVQNWVVRIQGKMIACATYGFTKNYEEIMNGTYKKDLFSGTHIEHMAYMLGDIAYRYAFVSKPILKLEIAAETIMNFLLDKFVDAAIYYDTDKELNDVQEKMIALISDNYKAIYKIYSKDKDEREKLYLRLLLVTDFICGMTDSYAKLLYQELNGLIE